MYIVVERSDDKGQYRPSVAVEVKHFAIYGFTSDGGLFLDVIYPDGEKERMKLAGDLRPFSPMVIGNEKNVQGISIVDYPASDILSRDEWRARFGVHMLHNGNHYYRPEGGSDAV